MHVFKIIKFSAQDFSLQLKICSEYIRGHIKQITMSQLGFIMKGLALVYHLQLMELEKDSKSLLSMLNGDYLWNNYVKKQQNLKKNTKINTKISGMKGKNAAGKNRINNISNMAHFKVMDIRQLLNYTRDRLDFYSSQHSEKLIECQEDIDMKQIELRKKVNDVFHNFHDDYQNIDMNDDIYNMKNPEGINYDELMKEQLQNLMSQDFGLDFKFDSDKEEQGKPFEILSKYFITDQKDISLNESIQDKMNAALSQDSIFKQNEQKIMSDNYFDDFNNIICSDHDQTLKPEKRGNGVLYNKNFQDFLMGFDKQSIKKRPLLFKGLDFFEAQVSLILKKDLKSVKKSKNDLFDDFILDLFSCKNNVSIDVQRYYSSENDTRADSMIPLDQSLIISTTKKQQLSLLLQNLGSSDGQNNFDVSEIRGGAAVSSSSNQYSSTNQLRVAIGDNDLKPQKLDFNQYEQVSNDVFMQQFIQFFPNDPQMNIDDPLIKDTTNMDIDFQHLKELETSNMFSRVHHNYNIQKHMTEKRLAILEQINKKLQKSRADHITFDEIVCKKTTKHEACEYFLSLLIFQQAGVCEIKQNKLRDQFSIESFHPIKIYKMV
ncbi:UNKNOWN [Stylonychia lemnae]|uniref:Uncharacterized protein n=1 Tax=Stylonychia lemnae TaxID=5949 RepID=A0A077ZY50_STYLE|nr:UNKNOWN [Stylonychia lemnae]|eukprot:CDW74157.1 UNKNOWN [Stylonychia lemnae]